MQSKAEFRAIREMVGMTQATLAGALGVQERSVRRWESEEAPQMPPQDAWELLWAAEERQEQVIDYALRKLDESGAQAVRLPYWASQRDYSEHSTDSALGAQGDWRMANANARALASILSEEGIEVEWVDGKENPALPR